VFEMVSDDELDLVETERLVDALQRRMGPTGGIALVTMADRSAVEEGTQVFYRGGYCQAIGGLVEGVRLLRMTRRRYRKEREG
jgi:hypothetical protein